MTPKPQRKSVEEVVRELADLIWNQNGKHSHINLDGAIRDSITTLLSEREAELVRELEGSILKKYRGFPLDTNESGFNNGIKTALTIIKEVFKKQS